MSGRGHALVQAARQAGDLPLQLQGHQLRLQLRGGQAGSGQVQVLMTLKHNVRGLNSDALLLADDKDMLEDLVAAAFNDAVRMAEEVSQQKMGKLTAGLPPGMKLPF